jgi:uncharacterized repeat protein (TIGR03803 family)
VNDSETILYNFAGPDGSTPVGGLISDKKGGLYGTTLYGGASNLGTLFKLNKIGTLTVLHSFAGPADGSLPEANLIHGPKGTFYGTTWQGGDSACNNGFGCGTVFKLVP